MSDLSRSMPGEVARRASRECFEGAVVGLAGVHLDSKLKTAVECARGINMAHFVDLPLFPILLDFFSCFVELD